MLIENSFEVPADVERVWSYLLDVERVVVCMPGAELTETIDDRNYKGKVRVKLGPVSLSFAGKVTMEERDDDAHRVVLKGSGMEQRGKGRAAATVTASAEATGEGTRVQVVQDLQVQGQVASLSRGMMGDVTAKLTQQFADCLEKNLRAEEPAGAPEPAVAAVDEPDKVAESQPAPASARPAAAPEQPPAQVGGSAAGGDVNAFSLVMGALWGAVKRAIARLFGRRGTS
jgi:uncharacterized protein